MYVLFKNIEVHTCMSFTGTDFAFNNTNLFLYINESFSKCIEQIFEYFVGCQFNLPVAFTHSNRISVLEGNLEKYNK